GLLAQCAAFLDGGLVHGGFREGNQLLDPFGNVFELLFVHWLWLLGLECEGHQFRFITVSQLLLRRKVLISCIHDLADIASIRSITSPWRIRCKGTTTPSLFGIITDKTVLALDLT